MPAGAARSAGVVEATVAAMAELGARPERIRAAIGPCIAQASYEVGPDLQQPVLAEDPASAALFLPVPGSDRLLFDLKGYVLRRLARAGVAERDGAGRGHLRRRGALLQRAAHAQARRRALRPAALGDHARPTERFALAEARAAGPPSG